VGWGAWGCVGGGLGCVGVCGVGWGAWGCVGGGLGCVGRAGICGGLMGGLWGMDANDPNLSAETGCFYEPA
jgi:hypothetical protein